MPNLRSNRPIQPTLLQNNQTKETGQFGFLVSKSTLEASTPRYSQEMPRKGPKVGESLRNLGCVTCPQCMYGILVQPTSNSRMGAGGGTVLG